MRAVLTLLVLLLGLLFSSCSILEKKVDRDPFRLGDLSRGSHEEALEVIRALGKINKGLKTYKGVGNLELAGERGTVKSRMMWIGDTPEKLRMELIGIHGQPVLQMASDGRWLYVYSLAEKQFHKLRIKDNTLEKYLSIPVRLTTITELLMGRIPIPPYTATEIIQRSSGDVHLLYVQEEKTGNIEKIFLNHDKTDVSAIEYRESGGKLIYRVTIGDDKVIDTYNIPFTIAVSDGGGRGIRISIDRFWTDVDVDPSIFVLPSPE